MYDDQVLTFDARNPRATRGFNADATLQGMITFDATLPRTYAHLNRTEPLRNINLVFKSKEPSERLDNGEHLGKWMKLPNDRIEFIIHTSPEAFDYLFNSRNFVKEITLRFNGPIVEKNKNVDKYDSYRGEPEFFFSTENQNHCIIDFQYSVG